MSDSRLPAQVDFAKPVFGVRGDPVKIYTLYIEDDRYSVPTLLTAEQDCDHKVMDQVAQILGGSSHYLAADIWDDDRKVGRVERREDLP